MAAHVQDEIPGKHGGVPLVRGLDPETAYRQDFALLVIVYRGLRSLGGETDDHFLHAVGGITVRLPFAVDIDAPNAFSALGDEGQFLLRPLVSEQLVVAVRVRVQVGQGRALRGLDAQAQVVTVFVRQGRDGGDGCPVVGDTLPKGLAHLIQVLNLSGGQGFAVPGKKALHQLPRPDGVVDRHGGRGEGGHDSGRRQQADGQAVQLVLFRCNFVHCQLLNPGGRKGRAAGQLHTAVLIAVQQVGNPFFHASASFVSSSFNLKRPLRSLVFTVDSFMSRAAAISFTPWA